MSEESTALMTDQASKMIEDANAPEVSQIANELNEHFSSIQNSVIEAAVLLAKAKRELNKDDFLELESLIPLSNSSILKWVKIGECKWIIDNQSMLAKTESWGTLHEITQLNDEQLTNFEEAYCKGDEPQSFTRNNVVEIRGLEGSNMVSIVSVQIDKDKTLSAEDIILVKKLVKKLDKIAGVTAVGKNSFKEDEKKPMKVVKDAKPKKKKTSEKTGTEENPSPDKE